MTAMATEKMAAALYYRLTKKARAIQDRKEGKKKGIKYFVTNRKCDV